jgi:hypothetical protein
MEGAPCEPSINKNGAHGAPYGIKDLKAYYFRLFKNVWVQGARNHEE